MTPEEAKALFVLLDDTAHTDLGFGESLRSALRKLMAALPTSHRGQATRVRSVIIGGPKPPGAPEPALFEVWRDLDAQSLLAFETDVEVLSPEPLIAHLASIIDQLHQRSVDPPNKGESRLQRRAVLAATPRIGIREGGHVPDEDTMGDFPSVIR
ncbi:hypothetical protein [Arthrobacter alpinus]|uniref:hypothetical protein n=1 Tax=Arthrobacter alpinus TaxID=656366 RepID=UPI000ACE62F6|nr:hypothetical protein [Arthrobacter alpinus]